MIKICPSGHPLSVPPRTDPALKAMPNQSINLSRAVLNLRDGLWSNPAGVGCGGHLLNHLLCNDEEFVLFSETHCQDRTEVSKYAFWSLSRFPLGSSKPCAQDN